MKVDDFRIQAKKILEGGLTPYKILRMRKETFLGFFDVEASNGGLIKAPSQKILMTREGQESVRVLLGRAFEEYTEACEALERDHTQEELIDSYNYLLSAGLYFIMFESQFPECYEKSCLFYENWRKASEKINFYYSPLMDLSHFSMLLGRILAVLRLRPWQKTLQAEASLYQTEVFCEVFSQIQSIMLRMFDSREEFEQRFVEKDLVLQFRLRSNY